MQAADVNNMLPIRPIENDAVSGYRCDVAYASTIFAHQTVCQQCFCLFLKSEQGVTRAIYYFWGVGAQWAICLRWCINTLQDNTFCIMQTLSSEEDTEGTPSGSI